MYSYPAIKLSVLQQPQLFSTVMYLDLLFGVCVIFVKSCKNLPFFHTAEDGS